MSILEAPHNARAALAARELRQQLIAPAGAVADQGIDLRRGRAGGKLGYPRRRIVITANPITPPWLDELIEFNESLRACFLGKHRLEQQSRRPPAVVMRDIVARHYGLRPDEIFGRSRVRRIVYPRHVAMYVCHHLTDLSLPQIGQIFGGRDHTSILHAVRAVEKRMAADYALKVEVERLLRNFLETAP